MHNAALWCADDRGLRAGSADDDDDDVDVDGDDADVDPQLENPELIDDDGGEVDEGEDSEEERLDAQAALASEMARAGATLDSGAGQGDAHDVDGVDDDDDDDDNSDDGDTDDSSGEDEDEDDDDDDDDDDDVGRPTDDAGSPLSSNYAQLPPTEASKQVTL